MIRLLLASIAAILCVPILGAALGLAQRAYFHARVARGAMKADEVPFFGVLLMRGMILVFCLIAAAAILSNIAGGVPGTGMPPKAPGGR